MIRKLVNGILAILILAVMVNSIALAFESGQSAISAAEAACRGQGVQLDRVTHTDSRVKVGLFGKSADVSFTGVRRDDPITIFVRLRKSYAFTDWQAVVVRDGVAE